MLDNFSHELYSISLWFNTTVAVYWKYLLYLFIGRHMTFPGFFWNSSFLIFFFFCWQIHFWDSQNDEEKVGGGMGNRGWGRRVIGLDERGINTSWITLVATAENLLFTFALLNGGVSDVETIYFVSVEQKRTVYRNYQVC